MRRGIENTACLKTSLLREALLSIQSEVRFEVMGVHSFTPISRGYYFLFSTPLNHRGEGSSTFFASVG